MIWTLGNHEFCAIIAGVQEQLELRPEPYSVVLGTGHWPGSTSVRPIVATGSVGSAELSVWLISIPLLTTQWGSHSMEASGDQP